MTLQPSGKTHRWAAILAGGDGTRLRELTHRISGDSRPKQFCPIFGGQSLLAHTRDRVAPLFCKDQIAFVLSASHERFYLEELRGVREQQKIVQPGNRGTAVGIALCLQSILREDEKAMVAFFPSDHYYSNNAAFRDSVESGLTRMEEYPRRILILGAEARYPETEYGWIEPGCTLVNSGANPLNLVARFWEKPDVQRAERLLDRGCLWNTFVMIGKAAAFMEALEECVPQLMRSLQSYGGPHQWASLFARIRPADFSKDVLSRVTNRLVVMRDSNSGWTDLGSPGRVMNVFGEDLLSGALEDLPATANCFV